jgi:hypothetical protein
MDNGRVIIETTAKDAIIGRLKKKLSGFLRTKVEIDVQAIGKPGAQAPLH